VRIRGVTKLANGVGKVSRHVQHGHLSGVYEGNAAAVPLRYANRFSRAATVSERRLCKSQAGGLFHQNRAATVSERASCISQRRSAEAPGAAESGLADRCISGLNPFYPAGVIESEIGPHGIGSIRRSSFLVAQGPCFWRPAVFLASFADLLAILGGGLSEIGNWVLLKIDRHSG